MEKLYTTEEVIKALQISKTTLYGYIHTGELETVKIGHYYRVRESELNRFLEEGVSEDYAQKLYKYLGRESNGQPKRK